MRTFPIILYVLLVMCVFTIGMVVGYNLPDSKNPNFARKVIVVEPIQKGSSGSHTFSPPSHHKNQP